MRLKRSPGWRALAGMAGRALVLVAVLAAAFGCSVPFLREVGYATLAQGERNGHEAFGRDYMIVTQGEASSRAAREMLERGGNVVDAAAAASFALAVERPQSTGLGGGGFMLIHWATSGEVIAVDFRETAPRRATEALFQDPAGRVIPGLSTEGIRAAAVPGLVAGILAVHGRYGKLPRRDVLAPSIRLARRGFRVYPHLAQALLARAQALRRFPAARATFLKADGTPYREGELLRQPDLARTLETIAERGTAGFYAGWVADALLAQQRELNGLITRDDLEGYQVRFRAPVLGTYRDYQIVSMPLPSAGGIQLVEILNLLEAQPLGRLGPSAAETIHSVAAAMQQSFADRARYLGDDDFVRVPVAGLTSKAYARALSQRLPARARKPWELEGDRPLPPEGGETTHFTIADRWGNVVSSTQTINGWFGSGVVVPGAGFVLNNEMDDFSAKPGMPNKFGVVSDRQNAIAPGKRPLSSMAPTLVRKNGRPVLALGSPAGSRIITCIALVALNYLQFQLPLYEAVAALRYHHQWRPDELEVEPPGFAPETARALEALGYRVVNRDSGCKVQAVAVEGDRLHGVSDPRGEGLALGEDWPPLARDPRRRAPIPPD
ncbi:gamma-glutamyltransferase [Candidatus Methylocalor cossyra]|uniref:Glutathione hydrolase proenzyme n=1 Tax=Candidatus Methylocalor cossyra TaxID=3108543 RepID=A0ABM9NII2_9GAMM